MQIYRLILPAWIFKSMVCSLFAGAAVVTQTSLIPEGCLPFRDFLFSFGIWGHGSGGCGWSVVDLRGQGAGFIFSV